VLVSAAAFLPPQILWCEGGVAYGKKDYPLRHLCNNRTLAGGNVIADSNVAAPSVNATAT